MSKQCVQCYNEKDEKEFSEHPQKTLCDACYLANDEAARSDPNALKVQAEEKIAVRDVFGKPPERPLHFDLEYQKV